MDTVTIDLNCDMGEFEHLDEAIDDLTIMPLISRCNIAVGGHAGNADTIKYCFTEAKKNNLRIGIHPSYSDKEGFGRRIINQSWAETAQSITQQIELGLRIAEETQIMIDHIKFHGALYNHIESDPEIATKTGQLITKYPNLAVLGMADGYLQMACETKAIRFIREGFIDRRYASQHQLQSRKEPGAVYESVDEILDQAMAIVRQQPIVSSTNEKLLITADSLCIHSDTPNALDCLRAIHRQFALESIQVA